MATKYWTGAVNGGTGTWDATNTTNWSLTSGGAGGASVPLTSEPVIFDANSGTGICTLGANIEIWSIDFTGYAGTLDFSTYKLMLNRVRTTVLQLGTTVKFTGSKRIELIGVSATGTRTVNGNLSSSTGGREANAPDIYVTGGTDTINLASTSIRNLDFTGFSGIFTSNYPSIYGDLTLSPTMTITSNTDQITLASTSATPRKITTNGVVINFPFYCDGVGGSWELQDDLNIATNKILRINNGTFNANGKNITTGGFISGAGTKTLNMGSGTWTVTGNDTALGYPAWWASFNPAGLTIIPGTATINMTSASTKTFAGNAKTYGTLNQGGAGQLIIQQANTFANITNTAKPATITFPANTTTTVNAFSVSGTNGNQVTINSSTAGTRATLSDASGVNSVSYTTIKDINATGGATWNAYRSLSNIDAGNNTGWDFLSTPVTTTTLAMRLGFGL